MSDVKWTEEQLGAITARGSTVLVSAAAGSGKTAVLVERLLRRIVNEKIDVTRFLIITFTKAAASELRRKIGDALSEMIEKNPSDKHLRRQLALVGNARISTVHSFCSWLLKNYGDIPELSGGFRVLDDAEGKILLSDTLRELIEEKYEQGEEGFLSLASYMSDTKTDGQLFSSVLEFYSKCMSHPYPEKWLAEIGGLYDVGGVSDVGDTLWGKEALAEIRGIIKRSIAMAKGALRDADKVAETSVKYHDFLVELISTLSKLDSDNWDELREKILNVKFKSRPSGTKLENQEIVERIKQCNDTVKKEIGEIGKKLMAETSAEILSDLSALSGYLHSFADVTAELCSKYKKEKLRRGVLEYSDLEHYTIELLIESYDSENDIVVPSETGLEVSESFSEILLDEFQDSNIIQDIIFRAVSREEKNLVMVGDVKQSIYGFRLADPAIFMKKYKSFKKNSEARGDEPRCITLSRNFRSRDEVIDASNGIFERIMTEDLGGVDYTGDQRLAVREEVSGREREDLQSEFVLIDSGAEEDELKGIEYEAKFVAAKIRSLVDFGFTVYDKKGNEKKVSYGDFAVLFRSASSSSLFYEREFERFGIPYSSPNATGLLSKSEINSIIAYLSVIDNPTNEVALLATLRSPLFGFSADELCRIRRAEKRTNMFYALERAAKDDAEISEKCKAFLSELAYMKTVSRGMSVCDLLWEIYNRTNALGVYGAMACGNERQKNLIALYDAARGFENTGYFGLYRFISQITALAENKGDIAAPAAHTPDSVTIMTEHKSKGLEFPIVFIGSAIRKFNIQDRLKTILIHPKFGVGMKMRDEEMTVDYDTVIRNVISRKISEEQRSEEMRLLYVAMTRAREKLFIVSSLDNAADAIRSAHSSVGNEAMRYTMLRSGIGAQNWLLLPLLETTAGDELAEYISEIPKGRESLRGLRAYVVPACMLEDADEKEAEIAEEKRMDIPAELEDMLSFEYPHLSAAATQSKITATGISAIKRDERTAKRRRAARPSFLREKKLTPAERGTALHMAMQFVDFSKCTDEDGAKSELLRLLEKKFLSEKQIEAIDTEKLVAFMNSEIGKELLSAKSLRREFKFSVLLPADEALGKAELCGEKLLLQGVIDMFYETEAGLTIVDFKTDRKKPSGETLESYSEQLRTYRRAISEITGKTAKRLVLYHVTSGEIMEVE